MEMLTYSLSECGGKPIYRYIYECIKKDILNGTIPSGEKLPSKRSLASNLEVAVVTIENAYSMLEAEGYIYTVEKKGYYVTEDMRAMFPGGIQAVDGAESEAGAVMKKTLITKKAPQSGANAYSNIVDDKKKNYKYDLTMSSAGRGSFPFDTWAKLSRRILLDKEETFTKAPENIGVYELRSAIADYLYEAKGISVGKANIIIGPGTEYLHHILIQLLGRNSFTAVEDPGYRNVGRIYEANGVRVIHVPVDQEGMRTDKLPTKGTKLVHVSPSHHFPLGCVMPVSRRQKLLEWADQCDAYVIEDDYDSELRSDGRPITPLYMMDRERVIYMNTFTRTLSPSVRIAYMVLPEKLMSMYNEKLSFYSGTVSGFEQYTLAAFIKEGYYERHIRRMRNLGRKKRSIFLETLKVSNLGKYVSFSEDKAGLYMIMETSEKIFQKKFRKILDEKSVKITQLGLYCYNSTPRFERRFLLCYGNLEENDMEKVIGIIEEAVKQSVKHGK